MGNRKAKKPELSWVEWSLVNNLLGTALSEIPKSKSLQQKFKSFKPEGWEKLNLIYKKINIRLYERHLGIK